MNEALKWAEEQEKKVPWWNLWDKLNWHIWKIRHENDRDETIPTANLSEYYCPIHKCNAYVGYNCPQCWAEEVHKIFIESMKSQSTS